MKARMMRMGFRRRIGKHRPGVRNLAWYATACDAIAGDVEVLMRGGNWQFYYVTIGE